MKESALVALSFLLCFKALTQALPGPAGLPNSTLSFF